MYDEETEAALIESGGYEEYASLPEQHRFVIPDGCHWADIRERAENLGAAIVGAMRKIELANPDTLYGVLQIFHYIRLNNETERAEYLKLVPNMGLKMKAKAFKKRVVERSDWREIAVDVMRICLNLKYQASAEFRKALVDSGDKYIVEDESNRKRKPDSWGTVLDTATNEYYGKNIMGRLLMELREKGMLEYTKFEF